MRGNSEIIQGIKVLLAQGEAGSSISTITKTSSSGAVDTYTITLTDGSTSTFEVTNGTPIQSIVLTSSDDTYDTYTVTDASGHVTTFNVKNHDGDITAFVTEINNLLANTPYLVSMESDELQLPVNTINDNDTSSLSTWSSNKIQQMFDDVSFDPEYTPAINPSASGGVDKGVLSGGVFKLGKMATVRLSLTLTSAISSSTYTGVAAYIPAPDTEFAPLDGYYDADNERRYPVTAFVDGDGALNFGSPSVNLPNGARIYFGGTYITE